MSPGFPASMWFGVDSWIKAAAILTQRVSMGVSGTGGRGAMTGGALCSRDIVDGVNKTFELQWFCLAIDALQITVNNNHGGRHHHDAILRPLWPHSAHNPPSRWRHPRMVRGFAGQRLPGQWRCIPRAGGGDQYPHHQGAD